jgi:hypothetical protein
VLEEIVGAVKRIENKPTHRSLVHRSSGIQWIRIEITQMLNTLIYKRTHKGDPDKSGIFGIHDCMGSVRAWGFDAVIGVGVKNPDRGSEGIASKINWIGINPYRADASSAEWNGARRPDWSTTFRGPLVRFDRFVFRDDEGPYLETLAPSLFCHLFKDAKHFVMSKNLPREMQEEVQDKHRTAEKQTPENSPSKFVPTVGDSIATPQRACRSKNSPECKSPKK